MLTTLVMGYWTQHAEALLPAPQSADLSAQIKNMPTGKGKPQIHCPVEACLGGLTPHQYTQDVSDPTQGKHAVYVANNVSGLSVCQCD